MSNRQVNLTKLRERAKKIIEGHHVDSTDTPVTADELNISHLIEELRVYQTELEIQNQELNSAQGTISLALEQYRALFENLPLPGIIIDNRGFIVEANRQACEFIGLRKNSALQHRSALQLFDQESRSQIYRVLRDRSNLTPQTLELLGIKVAGEQIIPCDVHIIHLHEESEQAVRTLLVLVDQSTEMSLRESEYHLEAVINNEPESINILNAQGMLLQMNPAGLAMLEADSLEQVADQPFLDFIVAEYRSAYADLQQQVLAGQSVKLRFELIGLQGGRRWMETHAVPMQAHGQSVILAVTRDISERKLAEEKLQLAASVFSNSREGILITDADGTIIDVNDAFSQITGYSREDAIGRNPRILSSGRQEKMVYETMWHSLLSAGLWSGELWNRHKNGEVYVEMLSISAVHDAEGVTRHYVGLFSDITHIKLHSQQMEHIAHYDGLTSLPNRVLLADRLQQAMAQTMRREQQLAVAFLDLDGFKAINDRYGHQAGDHLLIALANRMKHTLREGDTLARLGGDEFVVVLGDLDDVTTSQHMLGRLLSAAAQPVEYGDHLLQVSASLGVTYYPQRQEIDADQLLRQANQAMYQAKLAGKNRYHVFDADQDSSIRGRHEHIEDIRRAMRAGEFVLYYQPKVNMRSGMIAGVEALIRWQHPERGLLQPLEFLPAIEEHLLAITLGSWVIDTALTQLESWHAAGLKITLSVNLCARQLQQTDFVKYLSDILAAHPLIQPSYLELEVLETSALEDLEHVSHVIKACKEIGVKFALDDFGTGYSSLTYLKRLPVTTLKIDQSFVRDMLADPDDLAIVEGVLSLATAFYRQVIAEGVETVEHGKLLLQFGCELAQGYGIARPMPAHKLLDWASSWRPDDAWVELILVSRSDLPVFYAIVQQRAWISAMHNNLNGAQERPQPLNHLNSRLGMWLKGDGDAHYGLKPAFLDIKNCCEQVYLLTEELCQLQKNGRSAEASAKLEVLTSLSNVLLANMQLLLEEK
jgi:diguanylate cyclase (GGDEF)-like protein/PAS domain S-box-containing protein